MLIKNIMGKKSSESPYVLIDDTSSDDVTIKALLIEPRETRCLIYVRSKQQTIGNIRGNETEATYGDSVTAGGPIDSWHTQDCRYPAWEQHPRCRCKKQKKIKRCSYSDTVRETR